MIDVETKARTVAMNFDADRREKALDMVREAQGKRYCIRSGAPYWEAIGYLTDWGAGSPAYAHVDLGLFLSGEDFEIIAHYRPEPGGPAWFTMGAIWHPRDCRFSFHS